MPAQNSAAELLAQLPRKRQDLSGLVIGPGTGTSDSIPADVPHGAYIVPADSTQKLGLSGGADGDTVAAKLSNGEFQVSPEDVQRIGASVLDILRGVTHMPAREQQKSSEGYADGGLVNDVTRVGSSYSGMNVGGNITVNGQAPGGTFSENPAMRVPAGAAAGVGQSSPTVGVAQSVATPAGGAGGAGDTAAAAPMGWAERNAQRNLEVTASSIMPSRERDAAAAKLNALNPAVQPGGIQPVPGAAPVPMPSAASMLAAPSPYALSSRSPQSRLGMRPGFADGGLVRPEDAGAGRGRINPAFADPNAPAPTVAAVPAAPVAAPAPAAPAVVAAPVAPVAAQAPVSPSTGPLGRAASSMMAVPQIQVAQAPDMAVEAPTVRHSGNDWAARKRLENLETAASSITNQRRWGGQGDRSPDVVAFQQAFANDLAMQGAEANANQAAMRERGENARAVLGDIGASQRANLQEQGAGARAVLADLGANRRTMLQEVGQVERQKIASQGAVDAANARNQAPAGYRWSKDGTLEHIPGGPADPTVRGSRAPLNDTQAKALQFGTRMQEAGKVLDKLAKEGVDQPGLLKRIAGDGAWGNAVNWTQSPEQQQVEQSQRDFINAVLRRESGAAIADSEFNNARKQYFPQVGDSPEVIAQKRQNREIATAGIMAEVPDAEKRVGQVLGAANKANPEAKAERTITRSGTVNGRRVVQYSDGSVDYAN